MANEINILWASMSGTAEDVAKNFETKASDMGFQTNLLELNDVSMNDLEKMQNVAIITSTTGVGDLPTNGDDFWLDLEKSDKNFSKLNYSVCALGDRSHEIFCGAGNKVNKKLIELGANQIIEIQECDGSDEGSDEWGIKFLNKIKS